MERDRPQMQQTLSTRPDPDPTLRTTEGLLREIATLEKLLMARIASIETSITVAHEDLVRVPTQTDKAVGNLRDLVWSKFDEIAARFHTIGEQFNGVEIQSSERHQARDNEFKAFKEAIQIRFDERDARRNVEVGAAKEAVGAAFSAAKEAVASAFSAAKESAAKTEASINKQIDSMIALMTTSNNAIVGKIDELKDRLGRGEGVEKGRGDVVGWIFGAAGMLIGIVSAIAAVALVVHR